MSNPEAGFSRCRTEIPTHIVYLNSSAYLIWRVLNKTACGELFLEMPKERPPRNMYDGLFRTESW